MKKFALPTVIAVLICMGQTVVAKEKGEVSWTPPEDGIPVFQGKMKINHEGRAFAFAFAKGDKVVVCCATESGKKLKSASLKYNNSKLNLWEKSKFASVNNSVEITKEGVYNFNFYANKLAARNVFIDIYRIPGNTKDFNFAWMKYNNYQSETINYSIDSMLSYKDPVVTKKEFDLFNGYKIKDKEVFSDSFLVYAQTGVHESQAKKFNLDFNKSGLPSNASIKYYIYTLDSKLGGASHWKFANSAVSIASAVSILPIPGLKLATASAELAMNFIGPETGNEPLQYFMTNDYSDFGIVKEIYSWSNTGKSVTNFMAGKLDLGKKHVAYDGELHYIEKGKITNMLQVSAKPPQTSLCIMANPSNAKAKNATFSGRIVYTVPRYQKVKAEARSYKIETVKVDKEKTKVTKTESYGSIKL